jgi:hypothetical protein
MRYSRNPEKGSQDESDINCHRIDVLEAKGFAKKGLVQESRSGRTGDSRPYDTDSREDSQFYIEGDINDHLRKTNESHRKPSCKVHKNYRTPACSKNRKSGLFLGEQWSPKLGSRCRIYKILNDHAYQHTHNIQNMTMRSVVS